MFPQAIQQRSRSFYWLYCGVLPLLLVIWLIPLLGVAFTAIRGLGDITGGNYWGMPSQFMLWQNFYEVFTRTQTPLFILNSLLITLPTVALTLVLSAMSGFALGIYRFRFNLLVFFLFVGGNFVPFQILMVPVRDLSVRLGIYDTVWSLILFHSAFQTGFCTFFMRNFIRALPMELIDAARIEGASEWRIFYQIVLPLVRPALAALAVLVFTFIWNDYFWATILIQGNHAMPITVGLKSLNGEWLAQWQLVSAGSIAAALPPVLLFFFMQKHFIVGLTMGATKE